jgi:hypothetical protein
MPAVSALTARGRELLAELPSWAQEDPDVRAVIHVYAREAARLDEFVAELREDLFPGRATERGLAWWEALFGITPADDASVAARRAAALKGFQRSLGDSAGSAWEENVTGILGSGWTYAEEDPSTDPYEVTIEVALEAGQLAGLAAKLRSITPAHIHLNIVTGDGFILDISELDVESFGF